MRTYNALTCTVFVYYNIQMYAVYAAGRFGTYNVIFFFFFFPSYTLSVFSPRVSTFTTGPPTDGFSINSHCPLVAAPLSAAVYSSSVPPHFQEWI